VLAGTALVGGAAVVGGVVVGGLTFGGLAEAAAADEFDVLRLRWAAILTGGAIDPTHPDYATVLARLNSAAQQLRATLDTSSGRSALWSDAPVGSAYPSGNLFTCYDRLRTLAVCWATPGGIYYADPSLATDALAALDFLQTRAYNAGQTEYGNWWDWEIGAPQALQDICVLLYAQLGAAQLANHLAAIDHFVPSPYTMMSQAIASSGANRVDLARVVAVRGILGKVGTKIATARDSISDTLRYVLAGDGLYLDGSYVFHTNLALTGSYGLDQLRVTAQLAQLLQGSSWAVADATMTTLHRAVTTSYAPVVCRGLVTDTVRSRSISRSYAPDAADGLQASLHVLRLALTAPTDQAARLRSVAKGWLLANTIRPVSTYGGVAGMALAKPVLDDASIPAAAEPIGHTLLPDMDRTVHRRPGWAFSLSLSSARIARFESINGENVHGWHTGDGMGLLHLDSDPAQYNDAFWPTVDPYRLPGTTVDTGALADAAGSHTVPAATWVGGAVLDGQYAAIGMDLRGFGVTLTARKSWFCLDDCVVALGAGITSTDGRSIQTVVDNRNLHDPAGATLTVDGTVQSDSLGTPVTLSGIHWAHQAGTGGYLFPGGASLSTLRQDRTGSWHDINGGGSTTPITRRYLALWLDHGVSPSGATYAYALLPGLTSAATAARAASPTVQIVANTASVQAVTHAGLGLTAANFFAAGSVAGITVDAPCSVLMREANGQLTLSVADPTRSVATVTVQIARTGYVSATPGPGTSVIATGPNRITVLAEVGGAHGAPRNATLSTSGSPLAAGAATALVPVVDAYVRDGSYSGTNYGADTTLVVKATGNTDDGYNRIAYLRFDLSGLTRPVERAVLWVYGKTADSAGIQTGLRAWPVTDDTWTKSGLTWKTRPALTGAALGTEVQISTAPDWVGLDVTAFVAASAPAAGGDGRASLAIWQSTVPGLLVILNSRQNAANQPWLQLTTR
jgi:hyaluronate lyase